MKNKILVSTSTFASLDKAPLEKMVECGYEVILNPFKRKLSKKELLDLLPGVTGLIAGLETLDDEVMSQTDLRVISRCGAGLSNVDLDAAKNLGITVCNTPDGPTNAVAELTLGCLLGLLRMIPQMNKDLHDGKWSKKIGGELRGKTVLIIGFGRIGRRLAELMAPFGVEIVITDPFLNEVDEPFKLLPLGNALPLADIITLHSSGEECILTEHEFSFMKKGVLLMNASRGHLIDENALREFLNNGTVAGVWLDTFVQEPYEGILTKYPQVLLTPHVGSYTIETRKLMEMEAVNNLIAAFEEIELNVQ